MGPKHPTPVGREDEENHTNYTGAKALVATLCGGCSFECSKVDVSRKICSAGSNKHIVQLVLFETLLEKKAFFK